MSGFSKRFVCTAGLAAALLVAAPVASAQDQCAGGRSANGAMWLSILHPGLGEYFIQGWGPFRNCPPKKFWLGFIPGFGWPGYLQVKSAIDASKCRTNDEIAFKE